MWVTTLVTALQMANQGLLSLDALIKSVKAGRGKVLDASGSEVSVAQLEDARDRMLSHAGDVGDRAIADIVALSTALPPMQE